MRQRSIQQRTAPIRPQPGDGTGSGIAARCVGSGSGVVVLRVDQGGPEVLVIDPGRLPRSRPIDLRIAAPGRAKRCDDDEQAEPAGHAAAIEQ